MKKSLLLLASFAGLVACFGEKKPAEGQEATTTEATCPVEAAAPAPEAAKTEAAPAAPTAEPAPAEAAK